MADPRHGWHGSAWASLATDGVLGIINWSALEWALAGLRLEGGFESTSVE